jgi:transcriptional regulator with XRE-family HTH domain
MDKLEFNRLLGDYVRSKRALLKLSQPQLADRLGLDYQYISRVERGLISPTLYWISTLATAFEMQPEEFVKEMLEHIHSSKVSIKV